MVKRRIRKLESQFVPIPEDPAPKIWKAKHPKIGKRIKTIVSQSICLSGRIIRQTRIWTANENKKSPTPAKMILRMCNGVYPLSGRFPFVACPHQWEPFGSIMLYHPVRSN